MEFIASNVATESAVPEKPNAIVPRIAALPKIAAHLAKHKDMRAAIARLGRLRNILNLVPVNQAKPISAGPLIVLPRYLLAAAVLVAASAILMPRQNARTLAVFGTLQPHHARARVILLGATI